MWRGGRVLLVAESEVEKEGTMMFRGCFLDFSAFQSFSLSALYFLRVQ
jgi:hypothetical protein